VKSISLYVDKKTFVHEADPITKLYYIAFAILVSIVAPDLRVSVACAVLSVGLLAAAGVLKNAAPMFTFAFFVLVTVVIIQGLVGAGNKTPAFSLFGLVFYREGLMASAYIALRVINIISAFLILVLTAKPPDLVEDLVKAGLSPRIGYVIISIFQIIPQMMTTVDTITDAQRSRGMETQGSLAVRMKAFVPLIGPVVLNAFLNTRERAMALEVRAFSSGSKKSFLNERKPYPPAKTLRIIFIVCIAAAIIWRAVAR